MTPALPVSPMNVFVRYGGSAIIEAEPPTLEQIEQGAPDPFAKYDGFRLPTPGDHEIQFHEKLAPLFLPMRYKVLEGGRGSMKSWGVARALLILALMSKKRILCAREFQSSIADSVHKLLADQIAEMGLGPWYQVQKKTIVAPSTGSEFIFVGLGDLALMSGRTKIKSFEGVDICWIEEAESITKTSWEILIPTIRKAGSEIWLVYNPNLATDSTYDRFHVNPPPKTTRIVLNWRENPWLSTELLDEKNHLFAVDPEAAAHVWDGELRKHAEASIFRHKYISDVFEAPEGVRFYHGADWGFSNDPTVLLRGYITGTGSQAELWIDRESWGVGVDFASPDTNKLILCQDLSDPRSRPGLFEKIDTAKRWPIKADSARPETISYVRGVGGYNISGAEKWEGCVEDGIQHLRGFKTIHIHRDYCPHTLEEFKLYSYKTDRMTGEILPLIIDKHNHCIDALRYSLDGFIIKRGLANMWARLGAR